MFNKFLKIAALVLGTAIVPVCAYAEEMNAGTTTMSTGNAEQPAAQQATEKPYEIPKDAWLMSLIPLIPETICAGFMQDQELGKRFEELNITKESCMKLIPESSEKCKSEIYAEMPAMINEELAGVWGRKLGECIGRDFAEKHLLPK